jgi:hypothetical protein
MDKKILFSILSISVVLLSFILIFSFFDFSKTVIPSELIAIPSTSPNLNGEMSGSFWSKRSFS